MDSVAEMDMLVLLLHLQVLERGTDRFYQIPKFASFSVYLHRISPVHSFTVSAPPAIWC